MSIKDRLKKGSEKKEPRKKVSEKKASDKKSRKRKAADRRKRKAEEAEFIRIEELEKLMEETDDDIDPETIVSMYMPRRRAKTFGSALLRLDKLYIYLLVAVILVSSLFIVAFMQEKMGNFTINLNRLELYRKGIAIASDGNFTDPTARLSANSVQDATNITITDLPKDIDDIEGEHNGNNYMAYTYYVRNAGKEDVGYNARVTLDSCAKGAENAVRVAVWKNGERTVYAEPAANGKAEAGCVSFIDHDNVCSYVEENFLVGNVDKYTIVIWMEGEDPECVDSIVGGSVEFTMTIDAIGDDGTSLLMKFVQDIIDTLTNNKGIGAAGTDAPDYYHEGEVTWDNRRNQ